MRIRGLSTEDRLEAAGSRQRVVHRGSHRSSNPSSDLSINPSTITFWCVWCLDYLELQSRILDQIRMNMVYGHLRIETKISERSWYIHNLDYTIMPHPPSFAYMTTSFWKRRIWWVVFLIANDARQAGAGGRVLNVDSEESKRRDRREGSWLFSESAGHDAVSQHERKKPDMQSAVRSIGCRYWLSGLVVGTDCRRNSGAHFLQWYTCSVCSISHQTQTENPHYTYLRSSNIGWAFSWAEALRTTCVWWLLEVSCVPWTADVWVKWGKGI